MFIQPDVLDCPFPLDISAGHLLNRREILALSSLPGHTCPETAKHLVGCLGFPLLSDYLTLLRSLHLTSSFNEELD